MRFIPRLRRTAKQPQAPTVLVTGSAGLVGQAVLPRVESAGWKARRFDIENGFDVRDEREVRKAVKGCTAVIHAAAVPRDHQGSPSEIVATNLLGTWHVLAAAEEFGLSRVVCFSSVQVFGVLDGEGSPDYLPIDDDHPLRAARPYGMSKLLMEQMCEAWTSRTQIPTVVFRPVWIVDDYTLARVNIGNIELGGFVRVDDVADAVVRALEVDLDGHSRMLLCGPGQFDCSRAEAVLGWTAGGIGSAEEDAEGAGQ